MHILNFILLQWLNTVQMVLEQLLGWPGFNSQNVLSNLCQCHLYLLFCTHNNNKVSWTQKKVKNPVA